MTRRTVLARAYGGEPLQRALVELGATVAYLANPTRLAAVEAGESYPVGFPNEDVFDFDEDLYARLRGQWERDGKTDQSLWSQARPFRQAHVH
jgi:hypothetical protein